MGTLRTIIGVWFQFWGVIGILIGLGLLLFGTNLPAFDILGGLPLSVIQCNDTPDECVGTKFLPKLPNGGCFSGYTVNQDMICQRIGSDYTPPDITNTGSNGSLLGFSGLFILGVGVVNIIIGTVIRKN